MRRSLRQPAEEVAMGEDRARAETAEKAGTAGSTAKAESAGSDESAMKAERKKAGADELRRRVAALADEPPKSLREAVRRAARKHEEERGRG
ncbi:hypothetical protein I5Q34_05360 [Streptomyces sp. AV19]|uniref:hypothetical protein n=1 Tax=Streptomyces sp. AV19 TaxID=2793068 RepID=UPI0018FEB0E7|nr:hypothetical protein [Streptomyces sp. AV19]MBH1933727.1 hypothetical protein [Streptomyces sp. AV19]MDG4535768.1 hypothetical protein [Streptomyces sp. AV19]